MLAFIDENTILLLGLFLALFAISLGGYRNPVLAEIAGTGVRRSVFHVLKWPGAVLLRAFHNQRWHGEAVPVPPGTQVKMKRLAFRH